MANEVYMCDIVENLNDDTTNKLRVNCNREKQSFILKTNTESFTLPFSLAPDLAMVLLKQCELKINIPK